MDARETGLELWLRRLLLRSDLTPADVARLRDLPGIVQTIQSSRDIVRLGECTTHSCLVVEGVAARFGQTADGFRQLTAVYVPGDMGDLHSAVLPRASSALQSLSPVTVLRVPHEALNAAVAASPDIARAFWRDCVADGQVAAEWILALGRLGAQGRVAHFACELALRYEAIGRTRDRFPFQMTQIHLADATGMTPVHVNRVLRGLREDGLLAIEGREAVVLDWEALRVLAHFDAGYLHLEKAIR